MAAMRIIVTFKIGNFWMIYLLHWLLATSFHYKMHLVLILPYTTPPILDCIQCQFQPALVKQCKSSVTQTHTESVKIYFHSTLILIHLLLLNRHKTSSESNKTVTQKSNK